MTVERYKFQPDYAVHPGITLREKLEEIGMSPKEFAIRTGKPVKTISNILNCKSSITPEMAIKFEKVLGIPAGFWSSKQSSYNEYLARKKQSEKVKTLIGWANKFPYKELARMGYVKDTNNKTERAEQLLRFFNISDPKAWDDIYIDCKIPAFFRISLHSAKDPYTLSAFLRMGEIESDRMDCSSYSKKKLRELLPKLKLLTLENNFMDKIRKLCCSAGVKVIYIPYTLKTSVNGVVRWIGDNPVVILTDRFKRFDIFWFSLFHEIGHVLLHGNKRTIILEELEGIQEKNEQEKEADNFASEWLFPEGEYSRFFASVNFSGNIDHDYLLRLVKKAAEENMVDEDIVIGRILHKHPELYKSDLIKHKRMKQIDFSAYAGTGNRGGRNE